MPQIVSAEPQCEALHRVTTRGVTARYGRGRGCAIAVLVLSRQEIATDLRGPSPHGPAPALANGFTLATDSSAGAVIAFRGFFAMSVSWVTMMIKSNRCPKKPRPLAITLAGR